MYTECHTSFGGHGLSGKGDIAKYLSFVIFDEFYLDDCPSYF